MTSTVPSALQITSTVSVAAIANGVVPAAVVTVTVSPVAHSSSIVYVAVPEHNVHTLFVHVGAVPAPGALGVPTVPPPAATVYVQQAE